MDVGLQIALGLAAALAWGFGDFLSRGPTGRIGTPGLILTLGAVGSLALSALIAALGLPFPDAPAWAWGAAIGLGLLNVFAAHLIFLSFHEGPLSLTSPISASYAAVTFVLSLLTGETASPLAFAGLLAVLVGVPLAATPRADPALRSTPSRRLGRGLLLAMAAALLYGIVFWAYKYVTPHLGGPHATLVARFEQFLVMGTLIAVGLAKLPKEGRRSFAPWGVAAGVALLDTTAMASVVTGTSGGEAAVVVALSSGYSVVTVGLALAVLRERLAPHQWAGILLVVLGVVLVGLG